MIPPVSERLSENDLSLGVINYIESFVGFWTFLLVSSRLPTVSWKWLCVN